MKKVAVIIGAGPAGLTAAHQLLARSDIQPIIIEKMGDIGGLSKTVNYNGNRIDIGGHRFFSKSDHIMAYWQQILPIAHLGDEREDAMLVRERISRIYFNRAFFDYPIELNWALLRNLGVLRSAKIGLTYAHRVCFPIKPELSLQDFYINRFGDELYNTFFKAYTEKVWGIPCSAMSADWGAQRAKGVCVMRALAHFFKTMVQSSHSIAQKKVETSLIKRFLYPKYGPGQLWEAVARTIEHQGGIIMLKHAVIGLQTNGQRVTRVLVCNEQGEQSWIEADYVFSSMPIKDLVAGIQAEIPAMVKAAAQQLPYRDFLTVGLLIDRTLPLIDTWIYIQEPEVKLGRLQVFNNWSPYMVADCRYTWVGLEYFCMQGDELWQRSDADMHAFAVRELASIGLIDPSWVIDGTVLRVEKAYPGYWGGYERFDEIRKFTDMYHNLFLIGRNGMHRYNNMDHSMLSAIAAVDLALKNSQDKATLWCVNAEKEYHESKKQNSAQV